MLKDWNSKMSPQTTLIIASVSAGNVGQLAADAIINSLQLNFIGHVECLDCVLPTFGANPYDDNATKPNATAFSAYYSENCDVLLFMQRSEFIDWKKREFLERLLKFLTKENFARIVLLCGCFAFSRTDDELRRRNLQLLCTDAAQPSIPADLWKPENILQKRKDDVEGKDPEYRMPGGGLAGELFNKCQERKLPLIVFLKYIDEGLENFEDALEVATFADSCLKLRNNPVVN